MNIHGQCRLLMIDGHEILHGKIGDDSMNTHEVEANSCMDDEIEIAVGDLIGGDPRHEDIVRLECLKIASDDMRHIQSLGMEEDYLVDETAGEFIRGRAAMHAAFVLGEDEEGDDELIHLQECNKLQAAWLEEAWQKRDSLYKRASDLEAENSTLREALSRMEASHKAATDSLFSEPMARLKRAALDYRYSNASLHSADSLHRAAVNYGLWAESQTGHVGQRLGN